MDENSPLALPPELKARLDAAGVTDDESLQAALERDPELRAAYENFLNEHSDEISALQMNALLTAFAQTKNDAQIVEFWNQAPREWEQPFLDAAQNVIAQAEANGQGENVAGLKARLDALQKMLRVSENTPPVVSALLEFIGAPDDAAAREIFEQQRALLQPYEAQQLLESFAQADETQIRQRVQERLALLKELRGVAPKARAPHPLTPDPSPTLGEGSGSAVHISGTANVAGDLVVGDKIVQGDSFSAQRDMTVNKVAAGGTLNVTNINNFNFEYEWLPPSPPRPTGVIPREQEVGAVLEKLAEHDAVAIGGRAVAVQGMAGIGKTTLAQILAHFVYQKAMFPEYADGVLWTELGHERKTREHAQAVLNEWASYALRGNLEGKNFTPNAVRQLLERQPKLLVILDNVWHLDVVQPLQEALPAAARLLITTRSRDVMQSLGGGVFELDKLSDADARALMKLRLQWEPENDADKQWVEELFHALDNHALALDVALGLLRRQPAQAMWRTTAEKIIHSVQHGDAFDKLAMPANERQQNVERSLWVSYNALNENEKTHWRALGAFALEAPFATRFAARVWDCDDETAHAQLTDFMNAALVSSNPLGLGDPKGFGWQQHALLRGYALALLKDAGELEQTQARHVKAYSDAMREVAEQRYYEMRGAYPQLKHAFEWAIVQDLDRAQDLIVNCFNLQTAFGDTLDNYQWCVQALKAAKLRGTRANVAHAQVSLGNALWRAAPLPGQDRRQRLADALAAYDAALEHYHPDTAPLAYATTQNNRANILSDLATLPGQDRRQRLYDALAAYDEALKYRRPDTAPLDYAMTQNNRGLLLSDLATLPGEDRRQRLYDALAAYDAALEHYRPDTAPLDYAMTQNNRANRLSDLATLPGEDRRQRLADALAAYDAALEHYRPDTAPLDYAMTQNNRATILSDLATLPGEDRRARWLQALQCSWEAYTFFETLQHEQYRIVAQQTVKKMRDVCGNDFETLWNELGVGEPPEWLTAQDSATQKISLDPLYQFLNSRDLREMRELAEQHSWLTAQEIELLLDQIQDQVKDDEQAALMFAFKRALLAELRAKGIEQTFASLERAAQSSETIARFYAQLETYLETRQTAAQNENDVALWQQTVEAGDALLAEEFQALGDGMNWDALKEDLAGAYNSLGNAHDVAGNKKDALAAYERAIALQPAFAMWHRNRAGMLIELERCAEARAALDHARELEPDAARLPELEKEWEEKCRGA